MARYLQTAFILIVLSLAGCATGPTHDQSLNEQGVEAMQAGNMEQAEQLFLEAVSENPNNLQALSNLGKIYRNTSRPEQAREVYQQVIDRQGAAVEDGMDADEAALLAQDARENIAQIDQAEEMRRQEEAAAAERAAQLVALDEPLQPQPVPEVVVDDSGYRIQTGAFSIAANAEKMRNRLEGRHADLLSGRQVRLVNINGLTKVRIGPYASVQEAENACRAFKRAGVQCFRVSD